MKELEENKNLMISWNTSIGKIAKEVSENKYG